MNHINRVKMIFFFNRCHEVFTIQPLPHFFDPLYLTSASARIHTNPCACVCPQTMPICIASVTAERSQIDGVIKMSDTAMKVESSTLWMWGEEREGAREQKNVYAANKYIGGRSEWPPARS